MRGQGGQAWGAGAPAPRLGRGGCQPRGRRRPWRGGGSGGRPGGGAWRDGRRVHAQPAEAAAGRTGDCRVAPRPRADGGFAPRAHRAALAPGCTRGPAAAPAVAAGRRGRVLRLPNDVLVRRRPALLSRHAFHHRAARGRQHARAACNARRAGRRHRRGLRWLQRLVDGAGQVAAAARSQGDLRAKAIRRPAGRAPPVLGRGCGRAVRGGRGRRPRRHRARLRVGGLRGRDGGGAPAAV
mmetsp:Transcript_21023/g.65977  ORF Transcript_21023/g.65977 Transcript_21023/m.65977 type:complete len:239 (+) Transcript_21023:1607-2323(+)